MRPLPLVALMIAALVGRVMPAAAQSPAERAGACAAAGGVGSACAAAAVTVRQAVAHVGLLSGPGAEIPGEGSTLGRRLGGMPRVAAWVRGGLQEARVPNQAGPGGQERSGWTPALQTGLGLGVFDGFQLLPTVGGVLSLDVLAHASFLFVGGHAGYSERVDVLSFGGRVGLLRESFTLPGVSVSVARRLSGDVNVGDIAAGDSIEVVADPSVTSLRVTVSKDLYAFGVLVGAGWDDFNADTQLIVPDAGSGVVVSTGGLDGSRTLYFGSITKQLGILAWLTVEGGWAKGFDPVVGYAGGFDSTGSSLFASASILLKL